jgi:Flp pilus assembly pilin Flp
MLTYLYAYLRSFLAPLREEKGADLAEYALLLALIAIACIVAIGVLSTQIQLVFNHIGSVLSGVL